MCFSLRRPSPENKVKAEVKLLFNATTPADELPEPEELVEVVEEAAQNGTFNLTVVPQSIEILGEETFYTSIHPFCPSGCLLGDGAPTHANILSSLPQRPQNQHWLVQTPLQLWHHLWFFP